MDPKELRGLLEAYSEVYAPQEEIEEGMKPLPKEKMARQAQRAQGMENRAAASGDEKETNRQMQRRIAMQMPSSRRTILDKKKMGEEVEIDEAVKGESSERRKDLAAERRAGHRPKSAKEGENYASHKLAQMAYAKRKRMGEEVEQIDEISAGLAGKVVNARIERTGAAADRENRARTPQNVRDTVAAADKEAKARKLAAGVRARRAANEELEIFDVVLEFLQVEGYAETLEEAEWLMANVIDEEAIDIILGEEQLDEISLKTKMKAYAATQDPEADYQYGSKVHAQGDRIRKAIVKKHGEKAGEHADAHADSDHWGRTDKRTGKRQGYAKSRIEKNRTYRTTKAGKMHGQDQAKLKRDLEYRRSSRNEEYMDEAQEARNNPEKYEREQSKKSTPVRGEKTPMPPRGDKRREDFEKWYAANVR
jgi:hypothetical protein